MSFLLLPALAGKVLSPEPPAAAARPVRSMQSAQASTLDSSVPGDCGANTGNTCTPTGAGGVSCTTRIALPANAPSVAQTDTYTVVASYSATNAQSIWLTDDFGTVIAFANTAMGTGSKTFDVSPDQLSTNVYGGTNAYSQLPSSFTAHVRYETGGGATGCATMSGGATLSWNGVLSSVVSGAEYCCNALPDGSGPDTATADRVTTLALTSTYSAKQVTLIAQHSIA